MNYRLSDEKTWLLLYSYPLTIVEKAFLRLNCRDLQLKKEIIIPFVSTHYSNFGSKSISIKTNSLLSNVKDNKLKNAFNKYKVMHALK